MLFFYNQNNVIYISVLLLDLQNITLYFSNRKGENVTGREKCKGPDWDFNPGPLNLQSGTRAPLSCLPTGYTGIEPDRPPHFHVCTTSKK